MRTNACLPIVLTATTILFATTGLGGQTGATVPLDRATIVVSSEEPSFVQYGVEDLAGYLEDITTNEVPVVALPGSGKGVRILVGTASVKSLFPQAIPGEDLGDEGYLLRSVLKDGASYVLATGSTPRGTKLALGFLMRTVQADGRSAYVPTALDRLGKPGYAIRGMHTNGWALNYPYTFRSWSEEEWQRHLDILAYQGVNLLYFWPFMEIMPVPLSPEDEAYLKECRRIVDYARKKHGMEVWLMQCTNRVAKDRCGVADPKRRPYWRPSQEDLVPSRPEHFKAIMESREAMYRIINNADGVCNIDSDPGFLAEGTIEEYNKVLLGCRALLDRHNIHGKQAKIINWILWGWGREQKMQLEGLLEHQRVALKAMKEVMPQPFWLLSGQFPGFLDICRDNGLISQTVYFPYGVIEGEPAYPGTNVQIDRVRGSFDRPHAKYPGIAGIMGNVQTPLLQFPHLFYFTALTCDPKYLELSERDVLLEVSGHLFPDQREFLTDCYLGLKEEDPAKIDVIVAELEQTIQRDSFGRLGVFGRKLFPDHRIIHQTLLLQLKVRAARKKLLSGVTPAASKTECAKLLCHYLEAYWAWDMAHGWNRIYNWNIWQADGFPYGPLLNHDLAGKLRRALGSDSEVNAFFEQLAPALPAEGDAEAVRDQSLLILKQAVLAAPP